MAEAEHEKWRILYEEIKNMPEDERLLLDPICQALGNYQAVVNLLREYERMVWERE